MFIFLKDYIGREKGGLSRLHPSVSHKLEASEIVRKATSEEIEAFKVKSDKDKKAKISSMKKRFKEEQKEQKELEEKAENSKKSETDKLVDRRVKEALDIQRDKFQDFHDEEVKGYEKEIEELKAKLSKLENPEPNEGDKTKSK